MQKTLGGDRLGAGKKMKVELHGYERSTHNRSYIWRSSMSAGTLVPFMSQVALPGTTFDVKLDTIVRTLPTIGPLFGTYKVQLDLFQCPIRLYQGQLHNNKLGIGMNMANIKLPQIRLEAFPIPDPIPDDLDNFQVNPSCVLSYFGIRGIGSAPVIAEGRPTRDFNAVPLLAYWDIYKNYYANKQEEIGAVIHRQTPAPVQTVDNITLDGVTIPQNTGDSIIWDGEDGEFIIAYTGAEPNPDEIYLMTDQGVKQLTTIAVVSPIHATNQISLFLMHQFRGSKLGVYYWRYATAQDLPVVAPRVVTFDLARIDDMREWILSNTTDSNALIINDANIQPYNLLTDANENVSNLINTQEGLAIKTYQSDLFNNWLSTEWIDGANGISAVTSIDTSEGSFTIDTLNLSKKVYNMLNRIAVSGGTYDDWLDAVYTHDRFTRAESPIYHGGLIKELVFQEVVSNAESDAQPLGTLAGKGIMGDKHKGGRVRIKVDEPSYIIGIYSITPRIDYSQGNTWDVNLKTMDDFHKPALDQIGFQDLITEQMAWWDTTYSGVTLGGTWIQKSAGKQPAWINYMTNVNKTFGNFAIKNSEMFMTLNRRYEAIHDDEELPRIGDLTTYIDPAKFNHIFAQTNLDAQNFWVQVSVNIESRQKMSAKVMPNL